MQRTPSAGSRRPPPRPVEKSRVDPAKWSPEVIQALCQRLPGGRLTVTVKCQTCRSTFYPCLCPPAPTDTCKLRAPRIVELAESRRLQPNGQAHQRDMMGNLNLVKLFARTPGVDKHRLVLLGAKDPVMDDYLRQRHPYHRKGTVVFRCGAAYVLRLPDEAPWQQDLSLSPQELSSLVASVDDDLKVFEAPVLKTLAVEYDSEEAAYGDLELVRVPGLPGPAGAGTSRVPLGNATGLGNSSALGNLTAPGGKPSVNHDAFHVNDIRSGGRAHRLGVCRGHVLLELQRLAPEGRGEVRWAPFSPAQTDDLLPGPFCLIAPEPGLKDEAPDPRRRTRPGSAPPGVSVGRRGQGQGGQGGQWPWRLVFDALPAGWRVVGELPEESPNHSSAGHGTAGHPGSLSATLRPLTMERLRELADSGRGATLRFERAAYTVISRSGLVVRHDHSWDGETPPSRRDDVELLREWVTKSRMTPSQLSFAFKRIREVLTNELREFELERKMIEKMILDKARYCTDTRRFLASDAVRQQDREGLEQELASQQREIRNILEQTPLYFATELSSACVRPDQDSQPLLRSRPSMILKPGQGGTERIPCAHRTAKTRRNLLGLLAEQRGGQTLGDSPTSSPRTPTRGTLGLSRTRSIGALRCTGIPDQLEEQKWEVMDFVKEQADSFLGERRKPLLEDDAQQLSPTGRLVASRDGRLTLRDLKKILLDAGICWLSEEDIRSKFRALDVDHSGYLTMGEILEVTQRIEELLRQLRDFEEERRQSGAQLSHAELIEEFSTKLLLGSDLVGTKDHKVLQDKDITASSYHLNRPDHGRGQMWRSRLDCSDTPWVADASKPPHWIQWQFARPKLVTAVLTRGHPGKEPGCWVTKYRLEYALAPQGPWTDCGEEYKGNTDRTTTACTQLTRPVRALLVRLRVVAWVPHGRGPGPALRATLLGFDADSPAAERQL